MDKQNRVVRFFEKHVLRAISDRDSSKHAFQFFHPSCTSMALFVTVRYDAKKEVKVAKYDPTTSELSYLPMEQPSRKSLFAVRKPQTNLYAPRYYSDTDALIQYEGHQTAIEYWQKHIITALHFESKLECFVILWINLHGSIIGHVFSHGPGLMTPHDFAHDILTGPLNPIGIYNFVILQNHAGSNPRPIDDDYTLLLNLIEEAGCQHVEIADYILVGQTAYCWINPNSLACSFEKAT